MQNTVNLNLKKPDQNDFVNIGDINDNMDILDEEVAKKYVKPSTGVPKTDLSTDVQASLNKAESALQNVTKASVGLGNIDNTSDANKPVSTAQQSALDKKANLASPNLTGTPTAPTAAESTNTQQIATTAFVDRAVKTHQLDNVSHNTFATCLTTSTISEKIIVATGFNLVVGSRITVKFTNANTATTINLNINSTGIKPVKNTDGSDFVEALANGVYEFIYDGTSFIALNNGGGGSGGDYIYNGLTEPTKKDGIWVKSTDKIEQVSVVGGIDEFSNVADLPYATSGATSSSVGSNIYIFGGYIGGSATNWSFKYDTLTNTFTQIANMPVVYAYSTSVAIGTNIYIFGGAVPSYYYTYCYKYDTLANTFTQIANFPDTLAHSTSVAIGTNAYIFGGYTGSAVKNTCYKYDTLTNTFTKIVNFPTTLIYSTSVAIGTNAYIFGGDQGNGASSNCYKYDTLTNIFTPISNLPETKQLAVSSVIGNNVYILCGGGSGSALYSFKYDAISDTFTRIASLQNSRSYPTSSTVSGLIYIFGGTNTGTLKESLLYFPENRVKGYLVYSTSKSTRSIKISKKASTVLSKAHFNGAEVYYGDGTSWKILN